MLWRVLRRAIVSLQQLCLHDCTAFRTTAPEQTLQARGQQHSELAVDSYGPHTHQVVLCRRRRRREPRRDAPFHQPLVSHQHMRRSYPYSYDR